MPADQYMHRGAPTEWWWHIGTLKAGERVFGFEINVCAHTTDGFAFSQVMLSDVANAKHYQRTTFAVPPVAVNFDTWAEHDVVRDWHAGLGSPANFLAAIDITNPGSGYTSAPTVEITGGGGSQAVANAVVVAGMVMQILVTNPGRGYTSAPTVTIKGGGGTGAMAKAVRSYVTMDAAWGDPTNNMAVTAFLTDQATGTEITFDLMLSQQGRPFLVWGTGVNPILPPASGTHLQTNNYYYSLTRLDASGTITIGGEKLPVRGLTWMDHEYGYFGTAAHPVKWLLQDAQLDNGWTLSNYITVSNGDLKLNQPVKATATLQNADGDMFKADSVLTPIGRTWTSKASGKTYFLEFQVEIPSFQAKFTVTTLLDDQEFPSPVPGGPAVYEGVATATGTFLGKPASGTAWNEQAL